MRRITARRQQRRQGLATMDVVLIIGSLFPMCMILYYVAQRALANLYELVSLISGSPMM